MYGRKRANASSAVAGAVGRAEDPPIRRQQDVRRLVIGGAPDHHTVEPGREMLFHRIE